MTIKGLHHCAYRCRDAGRTRAFYEDFLGLPLVHTLRIRETRSGRPTDTLHVFFRLGDGSSVAFFEAPDLPFEFKDQHDFDLHLALETDRPTLEVMLARGRAAGIETRGPVDHGLFESIYLRDPNGYVIELCCPRDEAAGTADAARRSARGQLEQWQAERGRATPAA